ncbi:uncharacterized protein V6R79_025920 [Siganus canaliculatus]
MLTISCQCLSTSKILSTRHDCGSSECGCSKPRSVIGQKANVILYYVISAQLVFTAHIDDVIPVVNMDEREALKREIELLQNLINEHKSVHGDIPFARVEQRQHETPTSSRGPQSSSVIHPHRYRRGTYAPQNHTSWRKTYSLRNKYPQSSFGHGSASTSFSVHPPSTTSSSLPSHSREDQGDQTRTVTSGISLSKTGGPTTSITAIAKVPTETKKTDALTKSKAAALSQRENAKGGSSSASVSIERGTLPRQTQGSQPDAEKRGVQPRMLEQKSLGSSSETSFSVKAKSTIGSLRDLQTPLTSESSTESKQSVQTKPPASVTATDILPPPSAMSKVSKQHVTNSTSQSSHRPGSTTFLKKSKFTWVKSQNEGGAAHKQASSISSPTGKSVTIVPTLVPKTGAAPLIPISKTTPAKKFPRKLSPVAVVPRTSKYKWVSSGAGARTKMSRKSPSPKGLAVSQKALDKGETPKKVRGSPSLSIKVKKEIPSSVSSVSSSRYRWKAGGVQTSVTGVTGGPILARRRSAYHWTSEKSSKGAKGGLTGSSSLVQRTALAASSPGAFKLRSKMKIIRRTPTSGGGSEKGTSPSTVKHFPRGRIHSLTRSPLAVRRTPSRELVAFGRHKLRRLSPSYSRTSPTYSSHRSPTSLRVFGSRYKMTTRPGSATAHMLHYNPALSWRAKRIQSARSFLQSRLRSPHDRHPSSTQQWKGSGMRWIRGSLYRVSANKLSRTVVSNMSINRTGRSFSPSQASSFSPAFAQPSSTRHLASRAVQRSLAIIRHARQKKQPKQRQYCMYYNRFGKCNRGNSCPYIHDPDKVAVCTRFLRGTCKQADGTCPFSHKVAKEKMPVCSYFLKGICNNSECPYSHVYVSRKAEVCEDFVKGYCPEGEKCKKKHTLVCPDFSKTGSCPRGTRCKLQHRQRAKRSTSNTSTSAPAKRPRTKEPSKRHRLSVIIPQGSQTPETPQRSSLALPSFISLSSSPEDVDAPDTPLTKSSPVKEKKLQIKPRL